jgi:hypothetical protein
MWAWKLGINLRLISKPLRKFLPRPRRSECVVNPPRGRIQSPGAGVSSVIRTHILGTYACTTEKRATRTRLVVVAAGCALAAASWLRGVQQMRKCVTHAAAIHVGVCFAPVASRPIDHNITWYPQ